MKVCKKCGEEKENILFSKDKCREDGLSFYCRKCNSEIRRNYYDNNREYIKSASMRYKNNNPEKVRECSKKYYDNNREILKDKSKSYQNNNSKKIKQQKKKYYNENREYLNSKSKKYREENKDLISKNKKNYYKENREEILLKRKEYRISNQEKFKQKDKNYQLKNKDRINDYNKKYIKERCEKDVLFRLIKNLRTLISNSFKNASKTTTSVILGCSFEEFKIYLESKFESWMTWENRGLYNGEFNYGWDIDHIIPISSAKTEEEIIKLNHFTNLQPLCSKVNRDIKRNIIL